MKKNNLTILLLIIVAVLISLLASLNIFPAEAKLIVPWSVEKPLPELNIEIVDVGHGDFIIVKCSDKIMIIDTGDSSALSEVKAELKELGTDTIDLLVLTHPHSDHISNADWIIKNYDVREVHITAREHTTDAYMDLIDAIEKHQPDTTIIEPGMKFEFNGVKCEYLAPIDIDADDINNTSAVLRMVYGNKVLLFMGDALYEVEKVLLDKYGSELKADFLKVGHHANGSTRQDFAETVRPEVAAITMEDLSGYSKPEVKQVTIDRLISLGVKVLRSDINGDIFISTNGIMLSYSSEK